MLFSAFAVVIHVGIGGQDMQIFGQYGINTLHSPGLIPRCSALPSSVSMRAARKFRVILFFFVSGDGCDGAEVFVGAEVDIAEMPKAHNKGCYRIHTGG